MTCFFGFPLAKTETASYIIRLYFFHLEWAEKTEKRKIMKFFFKADWKKYLAGCIVYTLFGVFCVFADGELNPLNATVRLADPETESE